MKQEVKDLARKAGFVMWEEEEYWNPFCSVVDWVNDYDLELEEFYNLLVEKHEKETLELRKALADAVVTISQLNGEYA